jgi:hypothetical protein
MSENRDIIMEVVQDRAPATSESCINIATGNPFQAEVEIVADIDLNTAMGNDPREVVRLHVLNDADAATLAQGSEISIILFGKESRFILTRRSSNPASPLNEFGARKKVAGLDQS